MPYKVLDYKRTHVLKIYKIFFSEFNSHVNKGHNIKSLYHLMMVGSWVAFVLISYRML